MRMLWRDSKKGWQFGVKRRERFGSVQTLFGWLPLALDYCA